MWDGIDPKQIRVGLALLIIDSVMLMVVIALNWR